ncbi:MAG: hypothetical protein ACYSUX_16130 [Planctomycetota bacterium]
MRMSPGIGDKLILRGADYCRAGKRPGTESTRRLITGCAVIPGVIPERYLRRIGERDI